MPASPRSTTKSERTRAAILKAARELFAQQGYERTTVRDVAARASIDPAMVMRYFGSKEGLFARAAAFDLRLPDITGAKANRIGATLIAHFLDTWEGPRGNGSLVILLRAATSNEDAAQQIRTIFLGQVLPMLATVVPPAELPARSGLVATQILGLAVARYVMKVPPVVAMTREQIVKLIGPTLQRYIMGRL
jgi:AcrR family transcriptional regulator